MSGRGFLLLNLLITAVLGGLALRQYLAERRVQRHVGGRLAQLHALGRALPSPTRRRRISFAGAARGRTLPRAIRVQIARADLSLQPRTVGLAGAGAMLLCALVGWRLGWIAVMALLGFMILAVAVWLYRLVSGRIAAFVAGLPYFLDNVRQLMVVGNSLQQAVEKAALNTPLSVHRYLAPMTRRMQSGAAVGESITWLANRLDVLELHMLATAVQTNLRYGGRMSTVLGNLVGTLRDRARAMRELGSATAETRASGVVLGSLPVIAALGIGLTNFSYVQFFLDTTQGHHLLAVAVTLQILGTLAMRRIMRLDY
jgi:tight adherence protein B